MLYVFIDICITRLILRTTGKNYVKVYVGLYYTQAKAATKIRNVITKYIPYVSSELLPLM